MGIYLNDSIRVGLYWRLLAFIGVCGSLWVIVATSLACIAVVVLRGLSWVAFGPRWPA
jgi:hypothetical protein